MLLTFAFQANQSTTFILERDLVRFALSLGCLASKPLNFRLMKTLHLFKDSGIKRLSEDSS